MPSKAEVLLKVNNLYKLYGVNRQAARDLMKKGADKSEILKQTGVTVAVNNVSFEVERARYLFL